MPTLTVNTNVSKDKAALLGIMKSLSSTVAGCLGKPESYVQVYINPGQLLIMGGTEDPAAACSLVSIGGIDQDKNSKTSNAVMKILNESLGIKKNRMYINFVDVTRENMGYDGKTFQTL